MLSSFKAHGIANNVPYISEIWLSSAAHIVGDKKKYLAITSYESIKPAIQNNQADSHAILSINFSKTFIMKLERVINSLYNLSNYNFDAASKSCAPSLPAFFL